MFFVLELSVGISSFFSSTILYFFFCYAIGY